MKELEKLYLEAIENSKDRVVNYSVGDGHGENVWQVQDEKAAKECSEITENLLENFLEWVEANNGLVINLHSGKYQCFDNGTPISRKELLNLFIKEKYGRN